MEDKMEDTPIERRRWTVFVDPETKRLVKVLAAQSKMTIGAFLDELVSAAEENFAIVKGFEDRLSDDDFRKMVYSLSLEKSAGTIDADAILKAQAALVKAERSDG